MENESNRRNDLTPFILKKDSRKSTERLMNINEKKVKIFSKDKSSLYCEVNETSDHYVINFDLYDIQREEIRLDLAEANFNNGILTITLRKKTHHNKAKANSYWFQSTAETISKVTLESNLNLRSWLIT